ncbi:LuxR C-terminal-related transcriptional regulator [Bacillus atrophaeus]|uniref:helix-turn-helix domain-containing protein n=1 Tax=Bacillus atrophaeus TaxID=1452 RepID=UPI00227FA759|nr:LuxR C-terminal-related transcriptional regulator [Bacillus atrophaeus]MCY8813618.1 LuxR C-terminal-related transcriptional regulator [Bacillus atrophaeus]MCY8820309.1 LuxR C-terminal-related transcriptional regulator [Bacillus atrophaeus]MCY8828567.1 LuxR C-terminal-related transcriptional regulator [Bacillus atrophaeus]MCY8832654.1 LuxR C-terminal-related transcriptional regulator [Bacillus atrophaeus]MEC0749812.1 LuxR C-terminal-related transcriptional regulator [Bacillus atrophaeus]
MKEKEFQSKPLLTKREREVFELLVQDKTTKEIASELFISEKTVRNHISNAMRSCCKLRA